MYLTGILFALAVCYVHTYRVVDLGNGKLHILNVRQDVTLERGSTNFNFLKYLIIGRHPGYPLKRSLVQFESLRSSCPGQKIKFAKMYLYYVYAHKASFHSVRRTPFFSHNIVIHRVLKPWNERQTTSLYRVGKIRWYSQYLNLQKDATSAIQYPITRLNSGRPSGWMEFDVKRAVFDWKRGRPNYGLLIRVQNERVLGRDLRFASNAHNNRNLHAKIHVMCRY
ncbi:uncharacterized protein LOC130648899 [Hydractinia symbiolongicarpus]|uniref:uncharacterized protein LOC130648899 n=1 Tax=Hydractinia symbiolongicarpus TaxID=13093 RepID=UPI00254B2734|nr:uncharacterized protein LOC130648899 [Hydractinia symbiolongicarpus]